MQTGNLSDNIQQAIQRGMTTAGASIGQEVGNSLRRWLAQQGAAPGGPGGGGASKDTSNVITISGDTVINIYGSVTINGEVGGAGGGAGNPAQDTHDRNLHESKATRERWGQLAGLGLGLVGSGASAYFGYGEQLAGSGTMGDGQRQALIERAQGQGLGIIGGGLMAAGGTLMFANPALGAAVIGVGALANAGQSYLNRSAAENEQIGIGQQLGGSLQGWTGRSSADTNAMFNSFSPRQAVANEYMAAFKSLSTSMYAPTDKEFEAEVGKLKASGMKEPPAAEVSGRLAGKASLVGMFSDNLGRSLSDAYGDFTKETVVHGTRDETDAEYDARERRDAPHPYLPSGGGPGGGYDPTNTPGYGGRPGRQQVPTESLKREYNESHLTFAAMIGGEKAFAAMTGSVTREEIDKIKGGAYKQYAITGEEAQTLGSKASQWGSAANSLINNQDYRGANGGVQGITDAMRQEVAHQRAEVEKLTAQITTLESMPESNTVTGRRDIEGLRDQMLQKRAGADVNANAINAYDYSARGAQIGLHQADYEARASHAGFYGTPEDVLKQALRQPDIIGENIASITKYRDGESDPIKKNQATAELTKLQEAQAQAIDRATRAYDQMTVSVGQAGLSIAGSDQRRAAILGVGGPQGLDNANRVLGEAHNVTGLRITARDDIADQLRKAGKSEAEIRRNGDYIKADADVHSSRADEAEADVARADVPNSVGLRRQYSADRFAFDYLKMMPGSMGSLTGAGRASLRDIQGKMAEDNVDYEKLDRAGAFKGESGEALKEKYQERRQKNQLEYGSIYSELSYGWQTRLAGVVQGGPSGFGYVSPQLAEKAAVGAGVENPLYGSRSGTGSPDWLKGLQDPGGLGGAWNDPSGMGATSGRKVSSDGDFETVSMMGGSNQSGSFVISGTLDIPGIGTATLSNARITTGQAGATLRGSNTGTSAVGLAELLTNIGLLGAAQGRS